MTRAERANNRVAKAEASAEGRIQQGCRDPRCQWVGSFTLRMLEWDHIDADGSRNPANKKIANVATMVRDDSYTVDDVKTEIAKCECVCSNCHARRTDERRS